MNSDNLRCFKSDYRHHIELGGWIEHLQLIIATGLKESGLSETTANELAEQYGTMCRSTVEVRNGMIKPIASLPIEFYFGIQNLLGFDSPWGFILEAYIYHVTVPWDHKNNKPSEE